MESMLSLMEKKRFTIKFCPTSKEEEIIRDIVARCHLDTGIQITYPQALRCLVTAGIEARLANPPTPVVQVLRKTNQKQKDNAI